MRKREDEENGILSGSVRLQKYMAACGVASRRRCEDLVRAGRVRINGEVVQELGTKIDPQRDNVTLDGVRVEPPAQGLVYYMLNKPPGYLVTARDERGRKTIFELLEGIGARVVAVGRLDQDSEGLLLLTNDGELAHRLMHPTYHVDKEYEVWVRGGLEAGSCELLRKGVDIGDGRTQPAQVEVLERLKDSTHVRVVIREGRKRQVRRMMDAVGHPVLRLRRVREGPVRLGQLSPGGLRALEPGEVSQLKLQTGLA